MTGDDLTASRPTFACSDQVKTFLELTGLAQQVYLRLLLEGVARHGWASLVEMLAELQEDERTRDLVTRLGTIPRAVA